MLAGESPGSFSVGRTVDFMCTGETQHAASLLPGSLNFTCCLDVHEDLGRNAMTSRYVLNVPEDPSANSGAKDDGTSRMTVPRTGMFMKVSTT